MPRHPKNPFRLDIGVDPVKREQAFREGEALEGHINAVHGGVFNPECPACQDLQRRMDETESNKTEEHE